LYNMSGMKHITKKEDINTAQAYWSLFSKVMTVGCILTCFVTAIVILIIT